ncbi:hypothetical protein HPB47_006636 [Ixodes persulcatus]|uniref:Uncharacterized protein n=1 Tax=Ixodes persulcatus TaxID=34615 RepID=A0AC60PAP3_IXOPE|nr:hypothetical protein HPB47_006636 [Ixodes persulcatus]
MNHVWSLRMHSLAAKQRLVDAKELTIKGGGGGRCLVIDPANMAVKVKLHWVSYDVPNGQVKKELERYGKVSEITRELFREKGFEAVESNTRSMRLTLKEGYTVDSLPHEIRLEVCKVLVVVPGRAPLCLRCRRTGHIRRDCRVPRCSDCHRFGHEADDCVKTYASMARDRKVDDQLDFVMDDAEAEEAVGASGPTVLPPSDGGGSATPADVDHLAAPAGRSSSESVPQGARSAGVKTEEPQAQEQDHSQSDGIAPRESDGSTPSRDLSAPVPDADIEIGQVIKRLRDPTSTPEDAAAGWTATHPEAGTFAKRTRVQAKPRIPTEDRRRKNSL